ncbi:hypothetical protein NN561_012777 [Cricetulus griseus]
MRRPPSRAQAVIHTPSRLRSSLKPRRRSVQITMWLHIERGAEGGPGRREAQRAPRGRTAGPRAATLKGIDFAGSRAEPNRAEPSRAQRRGAQAAGASAQPRGSGCIASPAPAASASLPSAASSGGSSLSWGTAPPQSPDSPPPPPLLNPTRPGRLLSSPQPNMAAAVGRPEPKSRLGNSAPSPPPSALVPFVTTELSEHHGKCSSCR